MRSPIHASRRSRSWCSSTGNSIFICDFENSRADFCSLASATDNDVALLVTTPLQSEPEIATILQLSPRAPALNFQAAKPARAVLRKRPRRAQEAKVPEVPLPMGRPLEAGYLFDVLTCACGGKRALLAVITEPRNFLSALRHAASHARDRWRSAHAGTNRVFRLIVRAA